MNTSICMIVKNVKAHCSCVTFYDNILGEKSQKSLNTLKILMISKWYFGIDNYRFMFIDEYDLLDFVFCEI